MFIHYRTQGLILKKENRGEANQLFTVYTKDFGKLEILGKAIRKISSKLRSGAENFYLSEIEFIQGKTYKILTDAILIEKFQNLRNDLKRLKIALAISEILDNLVSDQEPDEKIWQLLNETFNKLNNCSLFFFRNFNTIEISKKQSKFPKEILIMCTVHCLLIYYYFLWNFLSVLGYKPELYHCSLCQKKLLPRSLYFSPKEGGIICQKCLMKEKESVKIEPEIVKILRLILEKNWKVLSKLKIEKSHPKSLKIISDHYLSFIGEKYS